MSLTDVGQDLGTGRYLKPHLGENESQEVILSTKVSDFLSDLKWPDLCKLGFKVQREQH